MTGKKRNALPELLLVLVFVADAVLCVAPRRIDVQREIDESVTLGEETTFRTIWTTFRTPSRAANPCIALPTSPTTCLASRMYRTPVSDVSDSQASPVGTEKNFTARRPQSANPTTCSR